MCVEKKIQTENLNKMTQEEKMKIFSYEKSLEALKIYLKLTRQIMPALADEKDRRTVFSFNEDIENKLKKLET